MDLFKRAGLKSVGIGGLKCRCCDRKLSHKRKSKINRNAFTQLRRARLKRLTYKESIEGELEAIDDNILITKK